MKPDEPLWGYMFLLGYLALTVHNQQYIFTCVGATDK